MKKRIFTFIILTYIGLCATSQTLLPVSGYFHLIGSINATNAVTLDLVKINDTIYADFQDLSENPQIQPDRIMLTGTMRKDGKIQLSEPFNDNGLVFNGKVDDKMHITGTWKTKTGNAFPATFSEKYPAGSLPFNLYSARESRKLVNKVGAPSALIDLAVLLPAESGHGQASDSLTTLIRECFFGTSNADSTAESLLISMKRDYFENYITTNQEMYKEMPEGMSYDWVMLKFMHIMTNTDNLLTFYITSYGFSGGAHGLETDQYYSVNLKSGKLITLQEVILPEKEELLSRLLTEKLKKMAGLESTAELTEAGYFTDTIKPGSNFYLTPEGVGFYYNQYDIAPYAFGTTDIFLTYNELKEILR